MYTVSITADQAIDALAAFMANYAPTYETIRSQVNRVAPPRGNFIEMTELFSVDLGRSIVTQATDSAANIYSPRRFDIQLDIYGENAGDIANGLKSVINSTYSYDLMPENIRILYASDAHQAALISGEDQYVTRWIMTVSLQINPVVQVPQQTANVLETKTTEAVDIFETL